MHVNIMTKLRPSHVLQCNSFFFLFASKSILLHQIKSIIEIEDWVKMDDIYSPDNLESRITNNENKVLKKSEIMIICKVHKHSHFLIVLGMFAWQISIGIKRKQKTGDRMLTYIIVNKLQSSWADTMLFGMRKLMFQRNMLVASIIIAEMLVMWPQNCTVLQPTIL
jgi:hypothetical protein